jgi:hypothetical protein
MAYANGPKIVTDGLVLCLDAANSKSYPGTGTAWNDLSGNGNNGTLQNTPTFNSANGGSLIFDAANDVVSLPNDIGYVSQVSAFGWFKTIGTAFNNYHIIFGSSELEVSFYQSGYIRVGVITSNGRYVSNHGSGLTDGNWHYGGFTFDGTTKKAYIDGAYVGSQVLSGTLVYSFSGRWMGSYSGGYGLNGHIGKAEIYNKTLSPNEVQQNYNALKGRYGLT